MSLSPAQAKVINSSVTGEQIPVGSILKALQEGKVGSAGSKTYAQGFNANAVGADALNWATVSATTSATAGTAVTATYTVPNAPSTWTGFAMVIYGNGYVTATPTYSSGVLTISVASTGTSQAVTILVVNNTN